MLPGRRSLERPAEPVEQLATFSHSLLTAPYDRPEWVGSRGSGSVSFCESAGMNSDPVARRRPLYWSSCSSEFSLRSWR
jgi:hypothetical protein